MSNYKYQLINDPDDTNNKNVKKYAVRNTVACAFICILIILLISSPINQDFDLVNLIFANPVRFQNVSTKAPKVLKSTSVTPITTKATLKPKCFLHTTTCQMPYVDPFDPEIKKIFHPYKASKSKCTHEDPLVRSIYDENKKLYILYLNTSLALKYQSPSESNEEYTSLLMPVTCCYQNIVRPGPSESKPDARIKLMPCVSFHHGFAVPHHIKYMLVDCKQTSTNKTLQKFAFSFIQRDSEDASNSTSSKTTKGKRKPSVLLIGMDSVSRINFRRNMPKTFKYFEEHNWFEMQGYNKVADNTFPNLMPILTGYNESASYKNCDPKKPGGLERCQFMWDTFRDANYYTAYGEDSPSISTFNYLKVGFKKPPTDFYLRPMMLAAEKKLKVTKVANLAYCVGRKQYGEYVYDYALEFARRFMDKPIFGLFWTNSFSHNEFDVPSSMDVKMVDYLHTFAKDGILDNTIVIVFSDHGMRFGKLPHTSQGFVEERWPMFFIWLPPWYRNAYPNYVDALAINQNRLTTPFDIHVTLNHIIKTFEPGAKVAKTRGCRKSQSLFKLVAENRTCADACIPEHWCTCSSYKRLDPKNETIYNIARLMIGHMNSFVQKKDVNSLCRPLELDKVMGAEVKIEHMETKFKLQTVVYRIKFTTSPSNAIFQATGSYHNKRKTMSLKMGEVSRLDCYEYTAKCMKLKELKKFCIC